MGSLRPFLITLQALVVLSLVGCRGHGAHSGIPNGTQAYDERFLKWLIKDHNDDDRMIDPCAKNETLRKDLHQRRPTTS
jgi:hypothetical protein